MAQNSFALMTNLGRAKEAAALANGTAIVITHIAIGDGTTVPSGGETSLYNEVARKAISGHGTVVGAANTAYFDIFLAAADGPYTIREAGLYDNVGDLIAIARYDPPISKPVPSSGQTVEGTVRLQVAFSNIANVTIVVDSSFTVPLQRISRLPWIAVNSMTETAPPSTPVIGDTYVIPAGATGAWSGQAGKIAEFTSAGWSIILPPNGHGISLPDGRIFEKVSGVYVEKIAQDVQSGKWLYAVASGTANALIVNLDPALSAYSNGLMVNVLVNATNTGSATIKFGSLGAVTIVQDDGVVLKGGELIAGQVATLVYRSGAFQLKGLLSVNRPPTLSQLWDTAGNYTFTVPSNVSVLFARVWGAGGGGGGSGGSSAGGGGGAGGYIEGWLRVTPGSSISVSVGLGGAAGTAGGGNGANGGTTSFGSLLTSTGGQGGKGTSSGATDGGTGGSGTGSGQKSFDGGTGQRSFVLSNFYLGGAGGAPYSVSPSQFVVSGGGSIAGRPGVEPGGGGGGGADGGAGGIGRSGTIQVMWG